MLDIDDMVNGMKRQQRTTVGFRLPKDLVARLQRMATKEGKTKTRLVQESLLAYLARNEQ